MTSPDDYDAVLAELRTNRGASSCKTRLLMAQKAFAHTSDYDSAIANYLAAFVVVLLGMYLLRAVRRKGAWVWFGLGVLGPFLLVCAHNLLCFGTPFTTNYRYGNPLFNTEGAFLDLFVAPDQFGAAGILSDWIAETEIRERCGNRSASAERGGSRWAGGAPGQSQREPGPSR